MTSSNHKLLAVLLAVVCLQAPTHAQNPSSAKQSHPAQPATAPLTLKSYTRMVGLDVVVEDHKGRHIKGLTANDFRIFEQTPSQSRQKRPQKIAEIREVHTAALAPPATPAKTAPGVYSNTVMVQKDPVPPTVLLVDGVNTQIQYQAQVHKQMLRMLRQLPPNIPVAVLLLGDHLRLLQGFTTDPALVQAALAKAESPVGQNLGHLNPKDDPDTAGNQFYGLPALAANDVAGMIAAAQGMDQRVYAADILERFDRTYTAFLSIARTLAGYPGRKNLLWLSTSFPMTLNSLPREGVLAYNDLAHVDVQRQMKVLDKALSDSKVSIYPVDIGGVRNLQVFSAEARPANPYAEPGATSMDAQRIAGASSRQLEMLNNEQNTMHELADTTGGKVCAGDNDIADCIHKAVSDGSDYYEISYYPNSSGWNGAYRKIFVDVDRHGAHLSYRQGYYATPEQSPDPKSHAADLQKDCHDLLDATGIAFSAKKLPTEKPNQLRFQLVINPSALTFLAAPGGAQRLHAEIGVCTYNEKGWPQKLMAYPLNLQIPADAYNTLISGGHLQDSVLVPGPKPASVRLIVKDLPSGKLGSVYIPVSTN